MGTLKSMGTLKAPLGSDVVHLCIDMQNLFAPGGPWPTPWLERVLPRVLALVEHAPAHTVFSRFLTAPSLSQAPGMWQAFYRKWPSLTRDRIDPHLLELVLALRNFVPPALVVDRTTYSVFGSVSLHPWLRRRNVGSLVITGSETDVCVLATVLTAVDLGYRVVIASDGVCSSSDATHDGLLELYGRRFDIQIELATCAEIIDSWQIS